MPVGAGRWRRAMPCRSLRSALALASAPMRQPRHEVTPKSRPPVVVLHDPQTRFWDTTVERVDLTSLATVTLRHTEMEWLMTTLRIEHSIHDYDLWKTAFDGFADVRTKAGVRAFTIRWPVDNPKYLMLDLEFDTIERAGAFVAFLEQNVWSSPNSSPGLAGLPQTQILDVIRNEER